MTCLENLNEISRSRNGKETAKALDVGHLKFISFSANLRRRANRFAVYFGCVHAFVRRRWSTEQFNSYTEVR